MTGHPARSGHPVRRRLAPYVAPSRSRRIAQGLVAWLRSLFHVDTALATVAIALSIVMVVRQLLVFVS